jgi:hypothetical protein
MALSKTTLNGAITQGATQLTLTSATGIAKKMWLRVDGEYMLVTDITNTPTLLVVRGVNGTPALAHNTLAIVAYGVQGDFNISSGVAGAPIYSYSVSGAITVPLSDQTVIIDKATAAAMTLAAPAYDTNPYVLITSATAAAHTVTAVTLLADGTSTTLKSTATFGTGIGASLGLEGVNGVWNVVSVENVTLA